MGTLLQSQTRILLDARNRSKITRALIGTNPLPPSWYAPTWVTAGGVLTNTPTLGAEYNTQANAASDPNGNEANATTGFTNANGVFSSVADPSIGSYALKLYQDSAVAATRIQFSPTTLAGQWLLNTLAAKHTGTPGSNFYVWSNFAFSPTEAITNAYANYALTNRTTSTAPILRYYTNYGTIGNEIFVDNYSLKPISLATLFATTNARLSNFNLVTPPITTLSALSQPGIVLCLDSATNPQNFVIAYLARVTGAASVIIEKCVAGVYTTLSTVAAAWGATKFFSAKKNGSSISIYYGTTAFGTLIATVTVADAGIVNNRRHGLFSTYSGNQFAGLFKVSPYAA